MAINTAQRRFSMLGFDGLDELVFQADGAVDADDRAMLLGLYSGITIDDVTTASTRSNLAATKKSKKTTNMRRYITTRRRRR